MFKTKVTKYDSINKESLEKLGWKFMKKYENATGEVYEKDNYYMFIGKDKLVRVIFRDPARFIDIISDPENFRLILKIETVQQLKQLETMLLWTSKSN